MTICGWFDEALSDEPTFDPGLSVDCPVCRELLALSDRVTVSFVVMARPDKSYFFRAHLDCWRAASAYQQSEIEGELVDSIVGGIH